MNQCEIRGNALSEFNGVHISGHDYVEIMNKEIIKDGCVINVQVLECIECGHISEGWSKL